MIELKDVVRYYDKFLAVDHLNLTIKDNEFFCLLGPNGAGKSTVIKMLCTLLLPTEGDVVIHGMNSRKKAREIRKMIGVVFENESLYEELTAWDNLEIFARFQNLPKKKLETRIKEILTMVELKSRAFDPVKSFSKGMKQRLLIARAIIHNPKVIFLDEPTVGLDPYAAEMMRNLILNIQKEYKSTIIMTTHYMEEATRLSDRIAIIDRGKLQCLGTPDELKEKYVPYAKVEIDSAQIEEIQERLVSHYQVKKDQGRLFVQISREESNPIQKILSILGEDELGLRSIRELEPGLEDVFLNVTKGGENNTTGF